MELGVQYVVRNAFSLKHLGDNNPDFITATKNLTNSFCKDLNNKLRKSDKVFYQSVGSKLIKSNSARFPLNMTTNFVKNFDGDNDGLVGEKSFEYGDKYIFLTPNGKRGISHGDMIDLNRENIEGFDVREFYVNLVSNLKELGSLLLIILFIVYKYIIRVLSRMIQFRIIWYCNFLLTFFYSMIKLNKNVLGGFL